MPLGKLAQPQLNLNSSWEWQSNQLDHPLHQHTTTFKPLPDNLGSWFLVCNLILTQLERQQKAAPWYSHKALVTSCWKLVNPIENSTSWQDLISSLPSLELLLWSTMSRWRCRHSISWTCPTATKFRPGSLGRFLFASSWSWCRKSTDWRDWPFQQQQEIILCTQASWPSWFAGSGTSSRLRYSDTLKIV